MDEKGGEGSPAVQKKCTIVSFKKGWKWGLETTSSNTHKHTNKHKYAQRGGVRGVDAEKERTAEMPHFYTEHCVI